MKQRPNIFKQRNRHGTRAQRAEALELHIAQHGVTVLPTIPPESDDESNTRDPHSLVAKELDRHNKAFARRAMKGGK